MERDTYPPARDRLVAISPSTFGRQLRLVISQNFLDIGVGYASLDLTTAGVRMVLNLNL